MRKLLTFSTIAAALLTAGCGAPSTTPVHRAADTGRTTPAGTGTAGQARDTTIAMFTDLAAGQYTAAYRLLTAAAQREIPVSEWTAFYKACSDLRVAYEITSVTVTGRTAAVQLRVVYAIDGVSTGPGSTTIRLIWDGRQWRYIPADTATWRNRTVLKDLAAARAQGVCTR